MVAFKPEIELRDNPVVRPLFFTAWPIEAPTVECEIVPISRMAPSVLTLPAMTFPIAGSKCGQRVTYRADKLVSRHGAGLVEMTPLITSFTDCKRKNNADCHSGLTIHLSLSRSDFRSGHRAVPQWRDPRTRQLRDGLPTSAQPKVRGGPTRRQSRRL